MEMTTEAELRRLRIVSQGQMTLSYLKLASRDETENRSEYFITLENSVHDFIHLANELADEIEKLEEK